MKNYFLAVFALMALVISSCEEDAPTVVPGAGIYTFGSATLVDGDINNPDTDVLLLRNVPVTGLGIVPEFPIQAGETDNTSGFVDAVLTGAAPCENLDATTWTYQINLQDNLNVAFICTSEDDLSEDIGSWQLIGDKLSMSISVSFSPIPIPIVISSVVITDTGISGTIDSFPMVKYIVYDDGTPMPIGGPIDGDITNTDASNLNVQYISVSVQLDKVP